ncbi:T9SS type A sorting domain-containing protein, partial [candidate division KSB1 bacterium]|nr:T9SS type A sorting domain-containing protein [candidate division KSB1 bacterium]
DLNAQVGSPIAADLDADGVAELLVTTYDGKLHCFASTGTGVSGIDQQSPYQFKLAQNYPNPFNAATRIHFQLPNADNVTLKIYNVQGQLVRTLIDKNMPAGAHQVRWDGKDHSNHSISTGVYIFTLRSGEYISSKKMALIQ